jgi:hypothetical protein
MSESLYNNVQGAIDAKTAVNNHMQEDLCHTQKLAARLLRTEARLQDYGPSRRRLARIWFSARELLSDHRTYETYLCDEIRRYSSKVAEASAELAIDDVGMATEACTLGYDADGALLDECLRRKSLNQLTLQARREVYHSLVRQYALLYRKEMR